MHYFRKERLWLLPKRTARQCFMDKKLTKKMAILISLFFLLILFLLSFLLTRIDKKMNQTEDSTTQTTETSIEPDTENVDNASSESDAASDTASTEEVIDSTGMTTGERDKTAALMASDVYLSDKEGDQKTDVGNLSISFNSDYAMSASLTVSGLKMDAVLYNDGNEDDLKGVIGNVPLFAGITAPSTIEQCQEILEEYIPDGTGQTAEWEESDNYFIRKFSGYDTADSCGVICYTIVPKKNKDSNVYVAVLAASKADTTITPISEESFHSMIDPIAEMVPESTLVNTDYASSMEELKDVTYYETATGESFGGLYELREAARDWNETVYGTDDPSTLTEEERKEKYWKYSDPEGYREAKYYAAEQKKEEQKAATEGNIKIVSDDSDTETAEESD